MTGRRESGQGSTRKRHRSPKRPLRDRGLIEGITRRRWRKRLGSQYRRRRNYRIRTRYLYCEPLKSLATHFSLTTVHTGRICKGLYSKRLRNIDIRARWSLGYETQKEIAKDHGLSEAAVWKICRGVERHDVLKERNDKIRRRYLNGEKQIVLAKRFNLTPAAICIICKGLNTNKERNREIRERYAAGETQRQLAEAFNLTPGRIGQICRD